MIIDRTLIRSTDPMVPHCGRCGQPSLVCECPHDRHATRDALLTYLRVDPRPVSVRAICKYMWQMHQVKGGAVREQLRRLVEAGEVTNPERGYYQIGERPAAKLPHPAAELTNGLFGQARG